MGKTVRDEKSNVRINFHKALREKQEDAWKDLNKALEHLKDSYLTVPKKQQRA